MKKICIIVPIWVKVTKSACTVWHFYGKLGNSWENSNGEEGGRDGTELWGEYLSELCDPVWDDWEFGEGDGMQTVRVNSCCCAWYVFGELWTKLEQEEIELTEEGEVKWLIGACGGYVLIGISWGGENEWIFEWGKLVERWGNDVDVEDDAWLKVLE